MFLLIGAVFAGHGISALLATGAYLYGWGCIAFGAVFWVTAIVHRHRTRTAPGRAANASMVERTTTRRTRLDRQARFNLAADVLIAVCVMSLTVTGTLTIVAFTQQAGERRRPGRS